ncbi:protein AGENET DOMAIN (AGD)-CONTAINING P1-like [Ipomoea triloba]|uniref:protein AGENET DOMAIN (AGD)-CONTAINING P1-like n=1 Tax=Ipomoea triloba TaxID=35885 RepID=UPI00125DAFD6|nr:protein AGENET DOMAIN (AGD)-CONTAINING P1-like [Ipomoea triloba]
MVVCELPGDKGYVVQYKTLVTDDFSGPLTEAVPGAEIWPQPAQVNAAIFDMYEEVDAFDNDVWWVGKITGKIGNRYYVYFETTGDEILYHKDRIRVHLDWVHHSWVLTQIQIQPETRTQPVS